MPDNNFEFEQNEEPIDSPLLDYLDALKYSGGIADERHTRIGDRQFRLVDQHINGTMAFAKMQAAILSQIPFREAADVNAQ